MAVTLETLRTWLDEAETARHKLMTQKGVVRVSGAAGSVEYSMADLDRLTSYIADLRARIDAGGSSSGAAYRPIYPTF